MSSTPASTSFNAPTQGRKHLIRQPRQKRSQQRFEAILDAAERLLMVQEPDAISIYTLAEEAEISPPSIYHFFSDAGQVFIALSERFLVNFVAGFDCPPSGPFTTWQELLQLRYREGLEYYNAHAPARRLLLGSGLSATIRGRDLENDRQLAQRTLEEMQSHFVMPEAPDMVERFTELLVISDALWALSVHRHGTITEAYEEQARRAREAYCRTFLPEYLPTRLPEDVVT